MTPWPGRSLFLSSQLRSQLALLLAACLAAGVFGFTRPPHRAKALAAPPPVQIGASFSARRAAYLGLDWKQAYAQILTLRFRVLRLSAYWDEIDENGYESLDWMMAAAEAAGQPVVLGVGMKALGWPEFFIPESLRPAAGERDGGDVTAGDPALRRATLEFVTATVSRYRDNHVLAAWQVENEPFNRAGPQRWWIGRDFVAQEAAAVRALDGRPLIVNVFSHFNRQLDAASSRHGFDLRQLLGFEVDSAERESLQMLGPGDILGMDVYTRIGYRSFGRLQVSTASGDWDDHVARWRVQATAQGRRAWITEAQAEPWEADQATYWEPRSFAASDIRTTFQGVKDAGYGTVLLWGVEYWLAKAALGDPAWLEAGRALLGEEAHAPPLASALH